MMTATAKRMAQFVPKLTIKGVGFRELSRRFGVSHTFCPMSRRSRAGSASNADPILRKIALLLALQSSRALEERVPPVHERDHERVHAKGIGSGVVKGRLVSNCEV